jgi:chromosome segregation ATPase
MELEQIVKRLEWLDQERRKDKTTIATLEKRLALVEGNKTKLEQEVNHLSGEISRLTAMLAKFDELEEALSKTKIELSRSLEGVEKQRSDYNREFEQVRRNELEQMNKSILEVKKNQEVLPDLKRALKLREEEDFRLARLIEEISHNQNESSREEEEFRRNQRLLDEVRRQDSKRLTDLQGEVSAFRKRMEEQRGKVDLAISNMRKLELRISELQNAESERRQGVTAFMEKQNLLLVERDRIWQNWQNIFDEISTQSDKLIEQIHTLDVLQRDLEKSKGSFEEVNKRFERRINELTEMQRLVEERFRQEWVTFKADDQKRWTNYTLAQDEQQNEINRQYAKINDRVISLDDTTQEMKDMLTLILEETQNRLQSTLSMARKWIEDYDNTFGS